MKESILLGLLQNTAILLAFSLLYDTWWNKNTEPKNILNKVITGLVIGLIGIVLMVTPWILVPGIVFDSRSVMLSITGMFFGKLPASIAMIITGIYRLSIGGDGVWMGLAVIVSSGLIGMLWNKFRPLRKSKHYIAELAVMGVLVHLVMLLCTFLLPVSQISETLKTITLPVLSIYPLATVLLGTLMYRQFLNFQNRKASGKLRKSKLELVKARIKAEESDNLKSIFLANMSHEIRTPMNSIMGFSGLLGDRNLDESERLQYLEIIKSSGKRLMQLINDILDLSKIEAKQLTINNASCSLSEILINSTESFRKSDLLKNKPAIELILNLADDDNGINFVSDGNRIQQVLDNLFNNAIKYTDRGKIETGFSIISEDNKEYIKIYVKDSGIGISEESGKKIFQRFRQIEEGSYHQGAGLGLSISKGIVELLGGRIWFVSQQNTGTTFYFTIPFTRTEKLTSETTSNPEVFPKLDGKTIIIAEDDYFSFRYLQLLLRGQNADIKRAENGSILLKMIKENVPDLILLDINMPVMSGFEFLSEMNKTGIKTKIIAQTAYAMPHERERCLNAGCTGYISKPVKKFELFEVINTAFS